MRYSWCSREQLTQKNYLSEAQPCVLLLQTFMLPRPGRPAPCFPPPGRCGSLPSSPPATARRESASRHKGEFGEVDDREMPRSPALRYHHQRLWAPLNSSMMTVLRGLSGSPTLTSVVSHERASSVPPSASLPKGISTLEWLLIGNNPNNQKQDPSPDARDVSLNSSLFA